MPSLEDRVELVTGASRGVGRGIAAELADRGAIVYATSRSGTWAGAHETGRAVSCNHASQLALTTLCERVERETGRIFLVVNVEWGGSSPPGSSTCLVQRVPSVLVAPGPRWMWTPRPVVGPAWW